MAISVALGGGGGGTQKAKGLGFGCSCSSIKVSTYPLCIRRPPPLLAGFALLPKRPPKQEATWHSSQGYQEHASTLVEERKTSDTSLCICQQQPPAHASTATDKQHWRLHASQKSLQKSLQNTWRVWTGGYSQERMPASTRRKRRGRGVRTVRLTGRQPAKVTMLTKRNSSSPCARTTGSHVVHACR